MLMKILERSINSGRLTIIGPDGTTVLGQKSDGGYDLDVVARLNGRMTPLKLAIRPDLYLGEAYMDGTLVIERGSLWELLELCSRGFDLAACHGIIYRVVAGLMRWLQQHNYARRAQRNAAHHYDLSHRLYHSFLDEDLQYSCAYFRHEGASLEEAQRAKKNHIASKLLLRPGYRVLDIGCGWGGLALTLAETEDVEVLGVTLSEEQLRVARQRAKDRRLHNQVKFELIDYRAISGKFDAIVSVGMFEHVGTPHYPEYFRKIAALLSDHGVALVHSIGRMHGPNFTSAWIRKYIFPGGYVPALSQVMPALEMSGLWLTDLEILRGHYAETLRQWRLNFLSSLPDLTEVYDQRFCRMWEYYLVMSEMAFRHGGMMVFQAQLAHHANSVPSTRDYMFDHERNLADFEATFLSANGELIDGFRSRFFAANDAPRQRSAPDHS